MKHILRSFTAALSFAAVALPGSPTAHAQTVGPNPPAMIITTSPCVISASGFYQLGANLMYNGNGNANDAIITVNAPNVTIDFGGHYISGPGTNMATTLYGVYANGQGNLTIQNGTISHCLEGIYLTGSSSGTQTNFNQTIRNLLVTHCFYVGIDLHFSSTAQVNNCQVSFIGGTTASAYAGTAAGIAIQDSPGLGNQANNNTVNSVTAGSGDGYGIFAFYSSITGNTVDTVTGSSAAYGIYEGNLQVGNKISNCATGLYSVGKYQNNLTFNCTTTITGGGTDAGGNN